jgi:hypothetical protein
MARIEHIKHRLERWGAWIERSESGGTGYPKQSSFLRLPGPMGVVMGPMTALDLECSDTHDAVQSMRHSKAAALQMRGADLQTEYAVPRGGEHHG